MSSGGLVGEMRLVGMHETENEAEAEHRKGVRGA